MEQLIIEPCYIYSLWSGMLKCHKGVLYQNPHNQDEGMFKNDVKVLSQCSIKPGIIKNATIWFPERNDEEAKKNLIKYYENQITLSEERIEKLKRQIQIVKEGVYNK